MAEERGPAKPELLHPPHERGDGRVLPADERISHLRQALWAIQTEAEDLEHAKILAHTAMRLDAGGAAGPKGHLRRFIEVADSPNERRFRRFLQAEPTHLVTPVGNLVMKIVRARVYEGIASLHLLDELAEAINYEPNLGARACVILFLNRWREGAIVDIDRLSDVCDVLCLDQFKLPEE